MTTGQKPELRPARPIYRNYDHIIAHLVKAATKRIQDTKRLETPHIEKVTPEMRVLQQRIVRLRKELKAAEKELAANHKARVSDACGQENGKLELTWEERRRVEALPERGYQERLRKVQRAKVRAALDTIDMTPSQAKRYFLALEERLVSI